MEGLPLGHGGEDITRPHKVAPRGRKASSTRKIKPQTSNLLKIVRQSPVYQQMRVPRWPILSWSGWAKYTHRYLSTCLQCQSGPYTTWKVLLTVHVSREVC